MDYPPSGAMVYVQIQGNATAWTDYYFNQWPSDNNNYTIGFQIGWGLSTASISYGALPFAANGTSFTATVVPGSGQYLPAAANASASVTILTPGLTLTSNQTDAYANGTDGSAYPLDAALIITPAYPLSSYVRYYIQLSGSAAYGQDYTITSTDPYFLLYPPDANGIIRIEDRSTGTPPPFSITPTPNTTDGSIVTATLAPEPGYNILSPSSLSVVLHQNAPRPDPTPVPTPVPTPTPTPIPESSPTPTPPAPSPTPTPAPTPTPQPSPDTTPTPAPSPTPSPVPAPTPTAGPDPSPSPSPVQVPSQAKTYGYDSSGRLLQVKYQNGHSVTYTYDAAGNIIATNYQ